MDHSEGYSVRVAQGHGNDVNHLESDHQDKNNQFSGPHNQPDRPPPSSTVLTDQPDPSQIDARSHQPAQEPISTAAATVGSSQARNYSSSTDSYPTAPSKDTTDPTSTHLSASQTRGDFQPSQPKPARAAEEGSNQQTASPFETTSTVGESSTVVPHATLASPVADDPLQQRTVEEARRYVEGELKKRAIHLLNLGPEPPTLVYHLDPTDKFGRPSFVFFGFYVHAMDKKKAKMLKGSLNTAGFNDQLVRGFSISPLT